MGAVTQGGGALGSRAQEGCVCGGWLPDTLGIGGQTGLLPRGGIKLGADELLEEKQVWL